VQNTLDVNSQSVGGEAGRQQLIRYQRQDNQPLANHRQSAAFAISGQQARQFIAPRLRGHSVSVEAAQSMPGQDAFTGYLSPALSHQYHHRQQPQQQVQAWTSGQSGLS